MPIQYETVIEIALFVKRYYLAGLNYYFMQHIPPNVFLSVFLPVLLFAAAFVLQWHFVQKLFYEAVLLAGRFLAHIPVSPSLMNAKLACKQTQWLLLDKAGQIHNFTSAYWMDFQLVMFLGIHRI